MPKTCKNPLRLAVPVLNFYRACLYPSWGSQSVLCITGKIYLSSQLADKWKQQCLISTLKKSVDDVFGVWKVPFPEIRKLNVE